MRVDAVGIAVGKINFCHGCFFGVFSCSRKKIKDNCLVWVLYHGMKSLTSGQTYKALKEVRNLIVIAVSMTPGGLGETRNSNGTGGTGGGACRSRQSPNCYLRLTSSGTLRQDNLDSGHYRTKGGGQWSVWSVDDLLDWSTICVDRGVGVGGGQWGSPEVTVEWRSYGGDCLLTIDFTTSLT